VKIGERTEEDVFLKVWRLFGMQELFERGLIALGERHFKLVAVGAKTGTSEQVPYELDGVERPSRY
jgi:hypothetical protein